MAHPEPLNDKARGKCLICRQAGHWAKSVLTVTNLLEQLATNAINWDIGQHSALGTQKPQGQVPSLPSRWFKRTEAARSSQPTRQRYHHRAEPRVHLDVQVGPRISWLTQGLLLCLISYSGAFSSQTCTILGATGKATTRRFTQAFLCCWDGQVFPPVSGGP